MKTRYKVLTGAAAVLALAVVAGAVLLSHDSPCGTAPALKPNAATMSAIVDRCYGSADVLKLEQILTPAPTANQLRVRIVAASVNPLDFHYMRGKPYIMRTGSGLGAPDSIRTGVDYSGVVDAVGSDVKRFKPGDEVFGSADGAFAQYLLVRESGALTLKPANVTFGQAAAIPIAGTTALQALRDYGKLQPGQSVLINGASGGVGTFAVQIAKALGAKVTGVCSTRNIALVRTLGADDVIDYTQQDFTAGAQRYDLIVDNVGSHSLAAYRRVLKPQGVLVIVGGPNKGDWLGPLMGAIKAQLVSPFVSQRLQFMLAQSRHEDLEYLAKLAQQGKLTSVIDRTYTLEEVPQAMRYVETGHARGKVVIDVAQTPAQIR